MKKKIIILSLIFLLIIVGVTLTIIIHGNQICKGASVSINYENASPFITESDILSIVDKLYPEIKTIKSSDVNIELIESSVKLNPFVEKVEVSLDLNGKINIQVKQKKPLVRVFNLKGESYYITYDKRLMPISKFGNERVVVASGEIKQKYNDSVILKDYISTDNTIDNYVLYKIWKTAMFVNENSFLKALIDQIYINFDNEIEMIPRVGDQLIILGDIDNLDTKFENLEAVYSQGFQKVGWDKYSIINLKFKNQVVCTRKQQ